MANYVLIHGAASDSWYWHRVVPLLRARGHDVVAPDLPVSDPAAGLPEYTDTVVEAVGDRKDLIVVAQSMGGFTAPRVCERLPVDLLVFVAAMLPKPGETMGQWWEATGWGEAKRESDARLGLPENTFDPKVAFFHDVPDDVTAEAWERGETQQTETPFGSPPLTAWPDVPTRFLLARQDRFLPADFQRRIVAERLGFAPDEMDSGHLPALAHPEELVERLEAYRVGAGL